METNGFFCQKCSFEYFGTNDETMFRKYILTVQVAVKLVQCCVGCMYTRYIFYTNAIFWRSGVTGTLTDYDCKRLKS